MYCFKDWKQKKIREKKGGGEEKRREGRITNQKIKVKANLHNKTMKLTKMWHKYKQLWKYKARSSNEPLNGIEILVLHL